MLLSIIGFFSESSDILIADPLLNHPDVDYTMFLCGNVITLKIFIVGADLWPVLCAKLCWTSIN